MKRIILALAIIGVVVAVWSGVWLFAAGQITQQVELAGNPGNPEIPALTCGNFSVTGFPFRFDASCDGATISQGDIAVTLPRLKATALIYRPTHLLAFADGPIHLSNAFYGTEQEVRFSLLEASLRLDGWQLQRLSLRGENIAWYDTLLGDILLASGDEAELHLLDIPTEHNPDAQLASLAFYAETKNADLTTFGVSGGQLTAEARITNLPDDIRAFGAPGMLQNWQAAGGKLVLEKLKANDAITMIDMHGQASLDETGAISGKIEGMSNQLAERFAEFVPPEYHSLYFGARQPDGRYKQTITIVKGTVFVGIAPQGTIPPLF